MTMTALILQTVLILPDPLNVAVIVDTLEMGQFAWTLMSAKKTHVVIMVSAQTIEVVSVVHVAQATRVMALTAST